jgi:hypothetical protein
MNEEFDCIIIGAGLAGLSAARTLISAGVSTLVLESSNRPGGRVTSDVVDGFTLDRGFQVINKGYPAVKNSGVLNQLHFTPITEGLIPFRVVGKSKNPQAIAHAFLSGVFLTDPVNISPLVKRKIYQSFITGKPGLFDGGAAAFSNALASGVSDIHYNEEVVKVSQGIVTTTSREYKTKNIIVATNPTTTHQLLNISTPLTMNRSTTWYHTSDTHIEGVGKFVVNLGGSLLNSFSISDRVPTYAPAGKQLFSSTTLKKLSESEVRKELAHIWGCDTSRWELVAEYAIEESLPLHNPGKPLFSESLISPGIYVAGDHWAYPSQQGAMESGIRAARSIIALQN